MDIMSFIKTVAESKVVGLYLFTLAHISYMVTAVFHSGSLEELGKLYSFLVIMSAFVCALVIISETYFEDTKN